jgi:hypothetical protein
MPIRQHAALKKINNDKSIGWIAILFGKALFEMAEPGRYRWATIEHLNNILSI